MIRTVKCKLEVPPSQVEHVEATLKAFADACNFAATFKTRRQYDLHHACYRKIREQFGLSAQLSVRAIARVAACKKENPKFFPTSIDYDARIFSMSLSQNYVSLTMLRFRVKFFLRLGEFQRNALAGTNPKSARLCKKKSGYYLHVQVEEPTPEPEESETMLGVDLGIRDVASLSDGQSFGGKGLSSYRLKRHKVRKSLQSKAHKGSRSTRKNARRALQRLSGREKAHARLINHTISKRIVDTAKASGSSIAIEDLTGIRERTNKRIRRSQRGLHNSWSFYQLRTFLEYKAARAGILVVPVNPAYTSKTCSVCCHIGQRSAKRFSCSNCGFSSDADFNGARNIAAVAGAISHPENSMLFCHVAN